MRLRDDVRHRAVHQKLAVKQIADLMAAFGFIHVMRADQNRDAVRRQKHGFHPRIRAAPWDRRPPSAHRAATGAACAECRRQATAVASSRRISCPASWFCRCSSPSRCKASRRRCMRVGHFIKPRDEFQILADGQIVIEAEFLRHIAGLAFDQRRLRADVEAEARALAGIGRQKTRTACGWSWFCRCRWGRGSRRSCRRAHRSSNRARPPLPLNDFRQVLNGDGKAVRSARMSLLSRVVFVDLRSTSTGKPGCIVPDAVRRRFEHEQKLVAVIAVVKFGRRIFGLRRYIGDMRGDTRPWRPSS